MTFERDIAVHLANIIVDAAPTASQLLGPIDLVIDENCRIGPVEPRDTGDDGTVVTGGVPQGTVVWVLGSGGFKFEAHKGGSRAAGGSFVWPGISRPTAQIVIMSPPHMYVEGQVISELVVTALDMNPASGYFEQRVRDGQAWYVDDTDEVDHEWSLNVEAKRCR